MLQSYQQILCISRVHLAIHRNLSILRCLVL